MGEFVGHFMDHFAADHAGQVRDKLATPSFLIDGAGVPST
jgi:hypothetical protein